MRLSRPATTLRSRNSLKHAPEANASSSLVTQSGLCVNQADLHVLTFFRRGRG
ncbi:hypothetical protein AZE42_10121, partial [Rhizopogon vesiculosus]